MRTFKHAAIFVVLSFTVFAQQEAMREAQVELKAKPAMREAQVEPKRNPIQISRYTDYLPSGQLEQRISSTQDIHYDLIPHCFAQYIY